MFHRILHSIIAAAALVATPLALPAHADTITVTDLAGREISVDAPVTRVLLGEGRYLPALGILDRDDPTRRVVGMMGDFERFDPSGYAHYVDAFPHLDDIPRIGQGTAASFSLENALSLEPDIAILGIGSGHSPGVKDKDIIDRLETAGIKVAVIDFRIDPLVNTPKSLELLGKLFGREQEAHEFLDFYAEQLAILDQRVAASGERPSVFMESHVGLREDCCMAMGNSVMGHFIDRAGGHNIVGDRIPGAIGQVGVETLLTEQPEHYIGTAIGSAATIEQFPGRIVLGAGADHAIAARTLNAAMDRPGFDQIGAVQEGRVYAIWHHFYNSPLNIAAVQEIAKWLHPDAFADVEPRQTLETMFERFQPVALDGVYWVKAE